MRKWSLKRWGCALMAIGLLFLVFWSVYPSLLSTQAFVNTQVTIVEYMKVNGGKWPSGWSDLSGEEIAGYQKRVKVAWDIDPYQVYESMPSDHWTPSGEKGLFVVYFPRELDEAPVDYQWHLPWILYHHIKESHR